MAPVKKVLKTCSKGHKYYKSLDCHTCPICEAESKSESGFLSKIVAPARRTLERESSTALTKLSKHSESEILQLQGMGPSTIPKLTRNTEEAGLTFKEK